MDANLFSQINTTISVRERDFLTPEKFQQLLQAKDLDSVAVLLQGTPYAMTTADLDDLNRIERVLMKALKEVYTWAKGETPVPEVVELFSLKYTYHNLKILLKARATGRTLSHLLLPLSRYAIEDLEHLVTTLTAERCPAFMQAEVVDTWQVFQDYKDIRALEVGMDMAYFQHLKHLVPELNHEALTQFVALEIDFYNVITVRRGLAHSKPRSFMLQLISDAGSRRAQDFIDLVENQDLASWFSQINTDGYDLDLRSYEAQMAAGSISIENLEKLADIIKFKTLEMGRYEAQGPLALARYLWGKELEVKNLRLVLTAHVNQMPMSTIEERMRPIYGQ